jgi:hypothetical protein
MEVRFRSKSLLRTFSSEKELVKTYGPTLGRFVMRMVSVLHAANSLAEVPHLFPERRHEFAGDRKGEFAVDLKHPYRLTLRPNHDPLPTKEDGGIDLQRVTQIIILEVEDFH